MAQLIKSAASKPDDLSVNPETHMVEREHQLPQVASDLRKTPWHMYIHAHTLINVKKDRETNKYISNKTTQY